MIVVKVNTIPSAMYKHRVTVCTASSSNLLLRVAITSAACRSKMPSYWFTSRNLYDSGRDKRARQQLAYVTHHPHQRTRLCELILMTNKSGDQEELWSDT